MALGGGVAPGAPIWVRGSRRFHTSLRCEDRAAQSTLGSLLPQRASIVGCHPGGWQCHQEGWLCPALVCQGSTWALQGQVCQSLSCPCVRDGQSEELPDTEKRLHSSCSQEIPKAWAHLLCWSPTLLTHPLLSRSPVASPPSFLTRDAAWLL